MDFEDIFSNNNSQYSQNPGCDNPFNDFLSLQSPISMPSADPSTMDMPSSYIGTANCLPTSNDHKQLEQPNYSFKNRTSDFTNPNYDFSYSFMNSPCIQPQTKPKAMKKQSLQNVVPTPQISIGSSQNPEISETEEPLNLTLNDIFNNFTLMQQQQQQQQQQRNLPIQQMKPKQLYPFKKKFQPMTSKKTFKPFVSLESCEFTVDKLRSFIETHKRRSMNHF